MNRSKIIIDRRRFNIFQRRTPELTNRMLMRLGRIGKNVVIDSMKSSPPDDTRAYRKLGRLFQSSMPGNPPRIATRELIRGIKVKRVDLFSVAVESLAPYSADLEFGNEDANLDARPYMGPMAMQLARIIRSSGIRVLGQYVTERDL